MKSIATIQEDEIRPDDLFNEFIALSARDAETFFNKKKFVDVACPGCGSNKTRNHFVKNTFRYCHCDGCGSIYVSPRPDATELLRYYAESKSQNFWVEEVLKKTGEKRRQSIMLPNIDRIEKIIEDAKFEPRRVLDIGSANGAFLAEWKKRHKFTDLIGIEPGQESARLCRELGIVVHEDFVENVAQKGGVHGDLVTCFEVIEHVQDAARFAKAIHGVTAPGGMAVMSCLGADGFDIQMLWEKSRSLSPPYHLNFLSIDGMTQLFKRSGFDKVEVFTPGRLDVQIVQRSMDRGVAPELSRFESLLLSRGEEALRAFQKFLADHCLSSHVWIVARRKG